MKLATVISDLHKQTSAKLEDCVKAKSGEVLNYSRNHSLMFDGITVRYIQVL